LIGSLCNRAGSICQEADIEEDTVWAATCPHYHRTTVCAGWPKICANGKICSSCAIEVCCQTVFVTQNWVSILSNVSWRHTFLRNIDDEMY